MFDYYKNKSVEYHDKSRITIEQNEDYEQYKGVAETYDKLIKELEAG
tara:strand:- start:320 stop:460 length:141 start_codon:yes stop_codon:yes gene_type:complete